jgi:predicted amidohydrolase YtcJ
MDSFADIIFRNANIITMDPAQPVARMVAVSGDRISLVGDDGQAEAVKGSKTRVIDCRGNTVVPGLNDAHCHVFSFIRKLLSVDLSPESVKSIADIKEAIRSRALDTPPGKWIEGAGYNDFYLTEKRHPNRHDLDEAAPNHPVAVTHRSLHACVLNSMALSVAEITGETAEPPGATIERELDTGEPDGLLLEMVGYLRSKVIPPVSGDGLTKGLSLANEYYLSAGITSLQEATVTNNLRMWRVFEQFKKKGRLAPRVYMMCGAGALRHFTDEGLVTGSGNGHLRLGGMKIVLTGNGNGFHPAFEELNRQVLEAHKNGFQVAVHAIEREAVEAAIEAIEYAQKQFPARGRRHRIEHCSECPPALVKRLKDLDIVVVSQPPFLYYSGERYLAKVPRDRQPYLYPFGSLIGGGLTVAAGSDSPVVPEEPLAGIYAAVNRKAEQGQLLQPEQRITAQQALAMYTANAAYASFEEGVKGSLERGKLADMVVLSDDPLTCPPEKIKDIRVEMTVLGGEVVRGGEG